MMNVNGYVNPFSSDWQNSWEKFPNLGTRKSILVGVASLTCFIATIPFAGIGGFAAFRFLVDRFSVISSTHSPTVKKTAGVALPLVLRRRQAIPSYVTKSLIGGGRQPNYVKKNEGGLPNLGSTCYINSSLQVILNTPAFSAMIDQRFAEINQEDAKSNEAAYVKALKTVKDVYLGRKKEMTLRAALKNLHEVVALHPRTRLSAFEKPWRGQQDAGEFLLAMLEALGYHFTLKTTYYGLGNRHIEGGNSTSASKIELPLVKDSCGNFSFSHLVENFAFEKITNGGWNAQRRDGSGFDKLKTHTVTQTIVDELPDTLVFQFKRYAFNVQTARPEKIGRPVEIGEEIDLKELIDPLLQKRALSTRYRVTGVIHHLGRYGGGHYFADIKTSGGWKRMNDSRVEKLSEKNAAEERKKGYIYVLERV